MPEQTTETSIESRTEPTTALERHLRAALTEATDSETRYHLREALQLLDVVHPTSNC